MNKKLTLSVVAGAMFAANAYAAPVSLSNAQMDTVAAGGVEKVDGFVCPAISGTGVSSSNQSKTARSKRWKSQTLETANHRHKKAPHKNTGL